MSQERLDKTCHLPLGTRDAIHVPFVVARFKYDIKEWEEFVEGIKPGSFVSFTDDTYQEFVICGKEMAQGILNPFLDQIDLIDNVVVFLMPGITTTVRHHFDIDPDKAKVERKILEKQLEKTKENDPECAECWMIKNNGLTRM